MFVGWQPKTAAVGIGDALDVVGNEHSQLEIDAFRRPQPVKVLQHRYTCDVLIPIRWMYQSGGGVKR